VINLQHSVIYYTDLGIDCNAIAVLGDRWVPHLPTSTPCQDSVDAAYYVGRYAFFPDCCKERS